MSASLDQKAGRKNCALLESKSSLDSGGSGQVSELLVAAKVGAANKLLSQCS